MYAEQVTFSYELRLFVMKINNFVAKILSKILGQNSQVNSLYIHTKKKQVPINIICVHKQLSSYSPTAC